jgi:hypothetical protein
MPQDRPVTLNYDGSTFGPDPESVKASGNDSVVFQLGASSVANAKLKITIHDDRHFSAKVLQHGPGQNGQAPLRVNVKPGFDTKTAYKCELLDGATGKAIVLMSGTQKLVLAITALAVAACATWFGTRTRDGTTIAAAPANALSSPAITPAPSSEPTRSHVRRLQSAAERTALVEQIRVAKQARAAAMPHATTGQTTTATAAPALPESTVDKAYIRRSVRQLLPLLKECYEHGLERDPKLAGTVVVDFTIEGEPGVGAVNGHSAIDDATSSLSDVATRECIQETMYALEIDPPADGGVVTVHYPFAFSSDGPPP